MKQGTVNTHKLVDISDYLVLHDIFLLLYFIGSVHKKLRSQDMSHTNTRILSLQQFTENKEWAAHSTTLNM